MSNTKHTPGPWRAAQGWIDPVIGDETQREYPDWIEVAGGDHAKGTYFSVSGHAKMPNARVLAAAPDLLEALEAFKAIDAFEGWHPKYRDAIEKAEAAIAKATGTP